MFNYFKKRYSRKNKSKGNRAFTLAELLVASAISAIVLSIAYSLVNLILTSNKSDNTNIGLSTKIENALDFVVDEVKSSKNVVSSWSGIPARCGRPNGEFVLGLTLPDQALTNDSYKNKSNVNLLSLKRSLNKKNLLLVLAIPIKQLPRLLENGHETFMKEVLNLYQLVIL